MLVLVSTCSLYIFGGFLALRLLRDPNQAVLTPAHTPFQATQSVPQTAVEA